MNNKPDECREQSRFDDFIGKILREGGYAAPVNEDEFDKMLESLEIEKPSNELAEKITDEVCRQEQYIMQIKAETIERLRRQRDIGSEDEDISGYFQAAARKKGKISEEAEKKLESDRAKLDQSFKDGKKPSDAE